MATAIAAWVNAGALWWVLQRRGHFAADARLKRTVPRLLAVTIVMAAVLFALGPVAAAQMRLGWLGNALVLAALLTGGGIVYLLGARLLGIFSLAGLRQQLSRPNS